MAAKALEHIFTASQREAMISETEKFWTSVRQQDSERCWEWLGFKACGYGRFYSSAARRSVVAHRWMYVYVYGQFDETLDVCHSCDNPSCVNPLHLFIGTARDNIEDCIRKGRRNSAAGEHTTYGRKTHCKHGHPWSPENTIIRERGWRRCKICLRKTAAKAGKRFRDKAKQLKEADRGPGR